MDRELNPRSDLTPLFEPKSIVVIGVLREGWFGGRTVVRNLLNFGFKGKIYPVNPSYDKILGLKVYPSISEVPEVASLAIVITPNRTVPIIVKECAEKGVEAVIIVSDGFAERNEEGARLQQEVVKIAKSSGLRILGPNTVGTVNTAIGLVTTPYLMGYEKIRRGCIALGAQTGIIGPQALPFWDLQYGISKICDFGNKCDVDESDLLQYLANDPDTRVVAMHLESVKDGRRFLSVAKEAVTKKPVLILKPGRTKESKSAIASHTGSLTGEDQIYNSAFKQAGIIRVKTFREFLELPKIFASQPPPKGNRIAIITITGAGGIVAIDTAVESGLSLAELSTKSLDKLAKIFPAMAGNPIDIGPAMVVVDYFSVYKETMDIILSDSNVDCVAISVWAGTLLGLQQSYIEMFGELKKNLSKPVAIWIYGAKLPIIHELSRRLENLGFPVYSDFETTIRAIGAMSKYHERLKRLNHT